MNVQPSRLFSTVEEQVFSALAELPANYVVLTQTEQIAVESDGVIYHYLPDFVVVAPDGRSLVIDVTSQLSLSLRNIAWLAIVGRYMRQAGKAFLLLVPDAQSPRVPDALAQEFDALHAAFVHDRRQIVDAVVAALDNIPPDQ